MWCSNNALAVTEANKHNLLLTKVPGSTKQLCGGTYEGWVYEISMKREDWLQFKWKTSPKPEVNGSGQNCVRCYLVKSQDCIHTCSRIISPLKWGFDNCKHFWMIITLIIKCSFNMNVFERQMLRDRRTMCRFLCEMAAFFFWIQGASNYVYCIFASGFHTCISLSFADIHLYCFHVQFIVNEASNGLEIGQRGKNIFADGIFKSECSTSYKTEVAKHQMKQDLV
jgi:hypothetical protein